MFSIIPGGEEEGEGGSRSASDHISSPASPKFFSFAGAASTFCGGRPLVRVVGVADLLNHCKPAENKDRSAHRYVQRKPIPPFCACISCCSGFKLVDSKNLEVENNPKYMCILCITIFKKTALFIPLKCLILPFCLNSYLKSFECGTQQRKS